MKKHFKLLSKSILLSVVSTTMISSGLILSSCVNKKDDSEDNNETPNGEIKIENQSPETNELTTDKSLTLYVNVVSNKPVKYQWYEDKNNNKWNVIEGANQSSYSITSDLMQGVTSFTTWKYKVEIYDSDDINIKLTSKIYSVNIKPQETTPNPSPDPSPEPNPNPAPPSKPDNNQTTSISSKSVSLENIGQLLPSQYLLNLNSATLNTSLINEAFDKTNVTNVSYTVNELNDQLGTLSLLMNYRENNIDRSYTFNFTNLLKLETNGRYHFEFENVTEILNISAQNIAEKNINNKQSFEQFLNEIKDFDINFNFKINGIKIPIKYLDFSNVKIDGFNTSWFTNNKKLILTFTFQSPKINYYVKIANENIVLKNFDYPSNISKNATMEFYSAADYLLNQITNNSSYSTNKYAAYYYYDIVNNEAIESQTKISENYWLSDVITELNYNGTRYVYKPILDSSNTVSIENSSLIINIRMQYQSNNSSNINSQKDKYITISGFTSYNQNDLFSSSNDVNNKFSLWCDPNNYDGNIEKLKKWKNKIIDKIDKMSNIDTIITFNDIDVPKKIVQNLYNSLVCKFSGIELIKQENKDYYSNSLTAIVGYDYNNDEILLCYDKSNDVLKLVIKEFNIIGVGLGNDNYAENPNEMIVNITHPGQSLQKLKDLT